MNKNHNGKDWTTNRESFHVESMQDESKGSCSKLANMSLRVCGMFCTAKSGALLVFTLNF